MPLICSRILPALLVLLSISLGGSLLRGEEPTAQDEVRFNRDVRPILSQSCFKCHGPDEETRESGLRLDQREAALGEADSGELAIVPGSPEMSELIRRIRSTDEFEQMPPPSVHTQLTEAQKETLEKWVAAGAKYEEHWSFLPPQQVEPPAVEDERWKRHPIDRFLRAEQTRQGLEPNEPAGRETIIRRVSLDLIGLPPTPEEIDAFLKDDSPEAYERLVDRLLESPHYGERWARKWLDLARYADTNGYEKDRPRSIWPYRDWVIDALNADMPFDRFTIEQLAGDMLPEATTSQQTATGFHRNTMLNEEGGIDPLEFRYHAMADRVATTGTAWLGLTLGCAQCHTHKYDPLTHKEYFQFMALLDNADEPDLDLPDENWESRWQSNLRQAEELLERLPNKWPLPDANWETPKPIQATSAEGTSYEPLEDGSVLFPAPRPAQDEYQLVLEKAEGQIQRLRLEALLDDRLPGKGPGHTPHGNFVLSEITITAEPISGEGEPVAVRIAKGEANAEQPNFPIANAFDGKPNTGWAVHVPNEPTNTRKEAIFHFEQPVGFPGGTRLKVTLSQNYGNDHTIGRVRLSLGRTEEMEQLTEDRRAEIVDARFQEWLKARESERNDWQVIRPTAATSNLPLLEIEEDGTVFASGDTTKQDTYKITFPAVGQRVTAIRLEALPDDRLPAHGPGMTFYEGRKGDFFLTRFILSHADQPIAMQGATESYAKNQFSQSVSAQLALDGDVQTGWSVADGPGRRHVAVFPLSQPVELTEPWQLTMVFGRHFASSLGKFRVSFTTDEPVAPAIELSEEVERILAIPADQRTESQRTELWYAFLLQAPELEQHAKRIRQLRQEPATATTMVLRERPSENPRPTYIRHRGEYTQPKDQVSPDVPSFLPPLPEGQSANRLELARWIVSPDNPLTARVTVNRHWRAFFGEGLVRTVDDFGLQGELPSHPKLLDWLALEFIERGWSVKQLHKLIVTSQAYRQSSVIDPEKRERDPENRYLARGPRGRLEAELVRDAALKVSGLLSDKMKGPSVYPPQPASITTEGTYGGLQWNVSQGEDRYRRSLYTFSKRTAPFAMFATFDAPSGEACVARRDLSNTPLQSLTLLNDETFVETAQALGKTWAEREGATSELASTMFRRVIGRQPTAEELESIVQFHQAQTERLAAGELNAAKLLGEESGENSPERQAEAAWTLLARALMNLDEFFTKK